MAKRKLLTRRDFIKAAGAGAVAMGSPDDLHPEVRARRVEGAEDPRLVALRTRFDKEWYDGFAKKWGEANGIQVTVDHIGLAESPRAPRPRSPRARATT